MWDKIRQFVTVIAISGGILINFVILNGPNPLTDNTISQNGERNQTLVEPAVFTFAIWGVIFLTQLLYMVYQALPSQRSNPYARRVGWWIVANAVIGGISLLTVGMAAWIGYLTLVAVLFTLIVINVRLGSGTHLPRKGDFWFIIVPYSIYFGWISVATIVTTSEFLKYTFNWDGGGFEPRFWAVLMLSVAAGLGLVMIFIRKNITYGVVIAWALIGVFFGQPDTMLVMYAALSLFVIVLVALVFALFRSRQVDKFPPKLSAN
jgi:hypothetical protein